MNERIRTPINDVVVILPGIMGSVLQKDVQTYRRVIEFLQEQFDKYLQ